MGKKDIYDKAYFTEPNRLAELICNGIYHGKVPICADNLRRLEQKYPTLTGSSGELERDGIFLYEKHGIKYGLEIENYSDYGMPRRVLTYDACEYERDASQIRIKHEKKRDYSNFEERKSGIKIDEGYYPVITMVLFLGQGHFKGKATLKECLQISEKLKPYVSEKIQNYGFPILEADYVNPLDFHTELREFFRAMQCRYDKSRLAELFQEEAFQNLSMDTQIIIAIHLEMEKLTNKVIEEKENMCKAYRELVEDWKEEGRNEGRLLDINNLMDSLRINAEQAMDFLKIQGEDRRICLSMLQEKKR